MSKKPFTLFFSYSHADEDLRDKLAEHLSSLKRNKVIDAWHDRQIPAGTQWAKAIDDNLNKADITLLLISSDFLDSEYCSGIEVKQAMARHNSNEARVIPIILSACDWTDEQFGALQALPKNAHPVTSWSDQDEAFLDIVKGIKRAILDLKGSVSKPVEPPLQPTVRNFVHFADFTSKSPSAPPVSVPVPEVKKNPVELVSAKGIDYHELEKLLKAKEWRSADELTAKLMFQVANRESQGWLDDESIKIFPCEDLRTIDQLWVHYSNSKFGFSIQKKLWLECGGEIGKYDYKVWKKFGAKVGWYHPQNADWRTYTEFMNDTKNSQDALPVGLPLGWEVGMICGMSSLASRLVNCNR